MHKTIFISHASRDSEIAQILKVSIEDTFANNVIVFASSIDLGEIWLPRIQAELAAAEISLFLMTPNSLERPWVWFEMGAVWRRHEGNEMLLIPVCYDISVEQLPRPLSDTQAIRLERAEDVRTLHTRIIDFLKHSVRGKITLQRARAAFRRLSAAYIQPAAASRTPLQDYQQAVLEALTHLAQQGSLPVQAFNIFEQYGIIDLQTMIALQDTAFTTLRRKDKS